MSDEPIAGIHPVEEALSSGRAIRRVLLSEGADASRFRTILAAASERGISVRRVPREHLDRVAAGRVHQGVVAVAEGLSYASLDSVLARAAAEPPALIVVLDQVQDPHNFGAVIRSAETAGAHGLVTAQRRAAPLSGTVARASAGAVEHLPVARVTNVVNALKTLKKNGIWVVGMDPEGETLWTGFDFTLPVAIVLGGEHRGVRRLVSEHCDVRLRLPVRGRVSSLNVSVSAGVVLYEAVRQRLGSGSGAAPGGRRSPGS